MEFVLELTSNGVELSFSAVKVTFLKLFRVRPEECLSRSFESPREDMSGLLGLEFSSHGLIGVVWSYPFGRGCRSVGSLVRERLLRELVLSGSSRSVDGLLMCEAGDDRDS